MTKNTKIWWCQHFLFLYRSSMADGLIMKLDQLVEPVKRSLLVYSLLHSPSNFCWHYCIAERSISQKQKQFFVFCKKDVIANKIFVQNIYRLHAFWSIWHWSNLISRHYAVVVQLPMAKRNLQLLTGTGLLYETLK